MPIITITPTSIPFTQNLLNINDKTDKDLLVMNGKYTVSSSSQLSNDQSAYNVFNGTTDTPWISALKNASDYTQDPYDNKHTISKYVGGGNDSTFWRTSIGNGKINIDGEWIQIELPNPIILVSYSILVYSAKEYGNGNNFPKVFFILGSNDGTKWSVVDQQHINNFPADISKPVSFNVYTPKKFKIFRIVFHQLFNGHAVSISQINMFGSTRIVVNEEPFSIIGNSIISPTILRNMSSINDFMPYDKYENSYTSTITTKTIETMDNQTTYTNTYNLLTTNDKYKNDYLGNIRSDKNKTFKDGITEDSKTILIQQNNMFILATLTVAFLTLGAIVISR